MTATAGRSVATGGRHIEGLTVSTTGSSVHGSREQRAGGLVRGELFPLRRGNRPIASASIPAVSAFSRLALSGALLTLIAALFAAHARAGEAQQPDPSPTSTRSSPASAQPSSRPIPDPAPPATGDSFSQAVEPRQAAPDPGPSQARSSSSGAVQPRETQPETQPKAHTPSSPASRAGRPAVPQTGGGHVSSPSGRTVPRTRESKRPTLAVATGASATAPTSGRPLLLGALALMALVLASSSLLHLVARFEQEGRRTR
jgi:hypothetical protein